MKPYILLLLFMLVTCNAGLFAQTEDQQVDETHISDIVSKLSTLLKDTYVFPDKGAEMSDLLLERLAEKSYSGTSDPRSLAETLTHDLQSVCHDLHVNVRHNPRFYEDLLATESPEDSLERLQRRAAWARQNNYGFRKVEIIDGDLGYIQLDGFSGSPDAGPTATAAMTFVSGCDAIIFDLRDNGGGSPQMIQYLTTYLYGDEPIHLNNFYNRHSDEISQTWTLPYVPGKKSAQADVYVLTSARTFSAAEEFTYNLKNLERATVIGETTGGGAHPGGVHPIEHGFTVFIPDGRAINPITGTNWEGTGVSPHVEIAADDALLKARILALGKLASADSENASSSQWFLDNLSVQLEPHQVAKDRLEKYAGIFGPRKVTYQDGTLYYQRDGGSKRVLIPLDDHTFYMQESPDFRLRFVEKETKVIAVEGHYRSGRRDRNERDGKT